MPARSLPIPGGRRRPGAVRTSARAISIGRPPLVIRGIADLACGKVVLGLQRPGETAGVSVGGYREGLAERSGMGAAVMLGEDLAEDLAEAAGPVRTVRRRALMGFPQVLRLGSVGPGCRSVDLRG